MKTDFLGVKVDLVSKKTLKLHIGEHLMEEAVRVGKRKEQKHYHYNID